MDLLFVFPRWQKLLESRPALKATLSGYKMGDFRMAGLGACTAAGAVPEGHTVRLLDEHVEAIDFDARPDMICLSFFTPQATSAYAIADRFRALGVTVIAGGIHPSVMPEETLQHCDAVVRGPVEGLWEVILDDHAKGSLKRLYQGRLDAPFARARRELMDHSTYLRSGIVQSARGCHFDCGFCVVPPYCGSRVVLRPIDEVVEDIAGLPYTTLFYGDENLLFPDETNRAYTRELLHRIIERGLRKDGFVANYPQFLSAIPDEDLTLLAKARVRQIYLVAGLKRPLRHELRDQRLLDTVQRMKRHGIRVFASFILGNDDDHEPVEPLIGDFCQETKTNLAEFIIHTPFPGTADFAEMDRQGRILDRTWERYNGANVVFQPLHETPQKLEERYVALWRAFYAPISETEVYRRYMRGFGRGVFAPGDSSDV